MSKFHQNKTFTPAPAGVVQRCGCGKSADATGECEECKAKKNAVAQQSVKSAGNELDASTRGFMESKFDQDFSKVRVHTDADAASASQQLGANAYTVGQHIGFAEGKYNPDTADGRKLLAHELTHTVQQNDNVMMQPAGEGSQEQIPQQQDVLEKEASEMELKVGDDEENQEDFEYESDPALEGEVEITEDEADAMLEEAEEQDAVAEEIEDIKGGSDQGTVAEEESMFEDGGATELAPPPKVQRPARKPRPAKHRPKEESKTGAKRIIVNLAKQEATAFEGDKAVRSMKISSGKATNPTDQGPTRITERDKNHRSNKYGNCVSGTSKKPTGKGKAGCKAGEKYEGAPMKYFQRFGGSAEGFHVGDISRPFASHGCVRLSETNAKWLWDWAKGGPPVNIIPGTKKKASKPRKKKKEKK